MHSPLFVFNLLKHVNDEKGIYVSRLFLNDSLINDNFLSNLPLKSSRLTLVNIVKVTLFGFSQ